MRKITLLTFLLLAFHAFSQKPYPVNYFRSPVDTAIALAGNFGEIRPNHFHAGFDIKTNGKEGMRVYAAADGYISRIKISPFGYGNALYIRHPNGYTTVYGHLKSFEGAIGILTKQIQYALESFEIDTLLQPDALPVTKGQLIALSGNTGGSDGPHLHFEIRETATEMPINPYFFGYQVPDTVAPKITRIAIYPLGANASVNGKHEIKQIKPKLLKGRYVITEKADTISLNGDIGFGIETYDNESNSTSPNGVFSIELQSGGRRVFYDELEKFTFENSRYVNAHIDYAEKKKHNVSIQKCFLSKNNQLGIYKNVQNGGVLHFADDSVHWVRYIVKDFAGNTTELMLKVRSTSKEMAQKADPAATAPQQRFDCMKENKYMQPDLQITIPANALYDDVNFTCSAGTRVSESFSPLYRIMSNETALQRSYALRIKAVDLPDTLKSKACIISLGENGRHFYEGGTYSDGWVSTQTKSFGTLTVVVDATAPKLKPAFKTEKNKTPDLSKEKILGILAKDNLSGIHAYRATIDGKWVLMSYEFKKDLLFYTFDNTLAPGQHLFTIDVSDDKGNTSNLHFQFTR